MNIFVNILFVIFLLGNTAQTVFGYYCPDWVEQEELDLCPKESSLFPDTRQASVRIISLHNSPTRTVVEFVVDVLISSENKVPLIVLPGIDESSLVVEKIKRELRRMAKLRFSSLEEQKRWQNMWIGALLPVPAAPSWLWQQDYFKPLINPFTGQPYLAYIDSYREDKRDYKESTQLIAEAINQRCPGLVEEEIGVLETEKESFSNTFSGGNFQGLAKGLCLHGSNQPEKYVKKYCGSLKNSVPVDVSWLQVGHSDEIFAVLPNKNSNNECKIAIAYGNFQKAIELINHDDHYEKKFFEYPKAQKLENMLSSANLLSLCRNLALVEKKFITDDRLIAPTTQQSSQIEDRARELCDIDILENLTNGSVAKPFTFLYGESYDLNHNFLSYNLNADKIIKNNVKIIKNKLAERCPGEAIKFIPFPMIFGTKKPFASLSTMNKNRALSILPNPTNLVVVGEHILIPEPGNEVFREYLEKKIDSLGLKTKFIDTFVSAHRDEGNLHCLTNQIPVRCRVQD